MAPKKAPPTGGRRIKKEGQASDLYRIGGVDLPVEVGLDLRKPQPTPLFPDYTPSQPAPLTESEQQEIDFYKAFREKVHNGPHYTLLGENVRVTKPGARVEKAAASFNAFEGMPRYSDRYSRKKSTIPKLDTRPYVKEFFPPELWSTIDPTSTSTTPHLPSLSSEWRAYKAKKIIIPGIDSLDDPTTTDPTDPTAPPANDSDNEANDKPPRDPEDEDPLMGEEVDDEYEDDDEDGGDYNAEQYFDGGGGGWGGGL